MASSHSQNQEDWGWTLNPCFLEAHALPGHQAACCLRQCPWKTPDTLAAQSLSPSPLNFPTAEW